MVYDVPQITDAAVYSRLLLSCPDAYNLLIRVAIAFGQSPGGSSVCEIRLIVLHEIIIQAQLLKIQGRPSLREIAAGVPEHLGFDDVHARLLGLDLIHQ